MNIFEKKKLSLSFTVAKEISLQEKSVRGDKSYTEKCSVKQDFK